MADTTSFFTPVNAKFATVTVEGGELPALPFLEAVEQWLPIFDRLGAFFAVVKNDIGGNVNKLKKIQAATGFTTLEQMVKKDVEAKIHEKSESACESLLWLKRALEFMILLLSQLAETTKEASECAREAYDATLSKFHGFIVRGTFSTALRMASSRQSMIAQLGSNEAVVLSDLKEWVKLVQPLVAHVAKYYTDNGLDRNAKV